MNVLSDLLPGRHRELIAHALEMVGGDIVFAHVAQGLCHESTGATGERKHSPGISTEIDLEVSQFHAGGSAIRVINKLGWNLVTEPELIGCAGGRRKYPQISLSTDGVDHGGCCRPHLAKNGMAVWHVVEPASDSANLPGAHQAGEYHANGARIPQVGEIMWGERPPRTLRLDPAEDLLGIIRGNSTIHVEKNVLFFQQSKTSDLDEGWQVSAPHHPFPLRTSSRS